MNRFRFVSLSLAIVAGLFGCVDPDNGQASEGSPEPNISSDSAPTGINQPSYATRQYDVALDKSGVTSDVEGDRIAWISDPIPKQSSRYAIWMDELPGGSASKLRTVPRDWFAGDIQVSDRHLVWIEYKETNDTAGPWTIYTFDFERDVLRILTDWRQTQLPADKQPIPYLSADDGVVVWNQRQKRGDDRPMMCIKRSTLDALHVRTVVCKAGTMVFPHFPRITDGVVSYIVNRRDGTSEPRTSEHPELADLFKSDGPLSDWALSTRAVQADARGVAWIAEMPNQQAGGRVFYWEPDGEPISYPTRDEFFPANELMLAGSILVWGEPEAENQVFAVRRELLGCESATVSLIDDSMKEGRTTVQLEGGSNTQTLVWLLRFGQDSTYSVKFAIVDFEQETPSDPTETCLP